MLPKMDFPQMEQNWNLTVLQDEDKCISFGCVTEDLSTEAVFQAFLLLDICHDWQWRSCQNNDNVCLLSYWIKKEKQCR